MFIKNVDYSTSKHELLEHFKECGPVKRCKICCDKQTGQPLGYAYIEFETMEGALRSKVLNESLFKGRQITVQPKRKNVPGMGKNAYVQQQQKQMVLNQQILAQTLGAAFTSSLFGVVGSGGTGVRGGRGRGPRRGGRYRPY